MSANALIVTVLTALVAAALALRVAAGPIPAPAGGSLYALGKSGTFEDPLAQSVELAASDAAPGR